MDAKEIIKVLEAETLKKPNDFKLKERLASLLLFKGEIEKAREVYTQVLKLNPDSTEGHWGLARISWHQRVYEDTYFHLSRLSKKANYQLTKEQALIYSKVLALKLDYKESSRWLDFAISQDITLLREELPLLRKIRRKLISEETYQGKDPQNHHPKSNFPFPPVPPNGVTNGGFPLLFPIAPGQNQNPANQVPNNLSGDKNQKQFIILEIFGGANSTSQGAQGLELPEREYLSQTELDNISELSTFEQIAGLAQAKQKLIQDLILPIKNPQICSVYSRSTNPKVLLYGPPGCGKSSLAKALAHETGVTVFHIEPSDFLDLGFEESEAKLAYLVQQARLNKPSVLLFDEISWLAGISNQYNLVESSESRIYKSNLLGVLFELLNEKVPANKQIGLLATTSKPWVLDSYSFPLSKINSSIFIPPPNKEEKTQILKSVLLAKKTPVIQISKINPEQIIEEIGDNFSTGEELNEFVNYCLARMMLKMLSKIQVNSEQKIELKKEEKEENLKEEDFLTTKQILEIFSAESSGGNTSSLNPWYDNFRRLANKSHPYHSLWKIANQTDLKNQKDQNKKQSSSNLIKRTFDNLQNIFNKNSQKPRTWIDSVLNLSGQESIKNKKSTKIRAKAKNHTKQTGKIRTKDVTRKNKK